MITHRYLWEEVEDMLKSRLVIPTNCPWRDDPRLGPQFRRWIEEQGGTIKAVSENQIRFFDISLPTEKHFLLMKLSW